MDLSSLMPTIPQTLLLLPFLLPIAIWVTWSDLKVMKIPNTAVMATVLVWLLLGWLAVPTLKLWLFGWALLLVVLLLGFLGNLGGLFGAGDAKFAAAMAPFFIGGNLQLILMLYACCSLAALALHRLLRRIPAIRRLTPDWKSWSSNKFPMGMALAGMLVFYHLAAFLPKG